ncbi:sensor histidine kinase [Streptosporangiaceae bacterium NEAU-GS5]|nr:sensor histidine kinase [Streptosporangiaceae bacterium NEAU-GS5]
MAAVKAADDKLRRARRLVRLVLIVTIAAGWLVVALTTIGSGTFTWVLIPAVLGLAVFTWLYIRVIDSVLDGRYPLKDVVVSGLVALATGVVGGLLSPGWHFITLIWLSVAPITLSRRATVLLSLGVFVVLAPLSAWSTILTSDRELTSDPATLAGLITGVVVYTAIMCAIFPCSNRLWVWIYGLAEEAYAGRDAQARLAVAEERLRFARDLHDLVGHQLSAIAVKSELAGRLARADAAAAGEEMGEVRTLARTALRELREAVRGYRELDLSAELGSVRGVLEAAGVDCRLHLPYRQVPETVAPVFAWVVREAVTNVLRHSTASRCDITVRFTDAAACLEVRNDGVPSDPAHDSKGTGLTGMGERLKAVGGTLIARPTGSGEFVLLAEVGAA